MVIYKITNLINKKVYIGQTIRTVEQRFHRHINDALNGILDTHFARAIRKYGPENFSVEVIDTATTQEELTEKESYWIKYYNSVNEGYNETSAQNKSGGNTYQSKTSEELKAIGEKIRVSKIGENNPNAKGIKCKNINTNEELHFGSLAEGQAYFQESNHQFISRRCLQQVKSLYKNEWLFAYETADYPNDYTIGVKSGKSKPVKVKDLLTQEEHIFNSYADAERYFSVALGGFRKCAAAKRGDKLFIVKNQYQITVLD